MRNAVKAVVDAYDGTVTLYAWDEDDPLLKAWREAFPGTVKDKDDIPADLLEHMRYPEDLFKVQRYMLAPLPRHRPERLLRRQRPLEGRRGPGGHRQASSRRTGCRSRPPAGRRNRCSR